MSKSLEAALLNCYGHLPPLMQNLAISAFGLFWYDRRFGGVFEEELSNAKRREYWDYDQWKAYQQAELRKILVHAISTVPYYQKLLLNRGFTEHTLRTFCVDDLPALPMLPKRTFRELCATEMLSSKLEPHGMFLHTSGSTGTPAKVLFSKRMHQKYFAICENAINHWAGVDRTMPRGMIGGRRVVKDGNARGPFYRYNFIERQVYLSAYHISANTARDYLEGIKKHKAQYMTGYASSNYFLARFFEEEDLEAPMMKSVLVSSERLTPEMRATFRRVYKCETFDSYNGVDLCSLISECEHHRLHIVPDVGIVEVLDESGDPCKPGDIGEVVCTGLLNFDQPLIRYRIGDYVKLSLDQSCPCGRNMIVVDEIIGRFEDTVVGPDGREMVRFHGIFIDLPSIIEGQIIQHELSRFEVRLVMARAMGQSDVATIKKRMTSQLGNVDVEINVVESIPREANGKFKAVVSHVARRRAA